MKIAISKLEPQETLIDIDSTAGIVGGGKTESVIYTGSTAFGDITLTQSDAEVINFEYETKYGVLTGSLGLGYTLGLAYDAK